MFGLDRQGRLPHTTCCHTFRATGITTYLQNGGTIEHAQQIANHESPRTTKLYDRTSDAISLAEIERILIQYGTATGPAIIPNVTPLKKVDMRQSRTCHLLPKTLSASSRCVPR